MFPQWGPVSMYRLMVMMGFAVSASYLYRAFSAMPGVRRRDVLWVLLGGFVVNSYGGALIAYLYRYFSEGYRGPYLGAGRYFHSVFLSTFLYGLIMAKRLRWPVKRCMDQYAIAAMLMSAIGRIGCFLRGCCAGKPTDLPWGLCFPEAPGVRVHPTQLYMLAIESAIFYFLWRMQRRQRYDGQIFWTGVWVYSVYRIWIETLRVNPIAFWGMTHAQLFSLVTLALSSGVLLYYRRRLLS